MKVGNTSLNKIIIYYGKTIFTNAMGILEGRLPIPMAIALEYFRYIVVEF
jgi:hypothetical protein